MRKLWGGAFTGALCEPAAEFGKSLHSDLRFWREDVLVSIAHARMLGATGILRAQDAEQLVSGLTQILKDGPAALPADCEDIHAAVESRLTELIGPVAGMLHTARSRNDQVATDARLYVRARIVSLLPLLKDLQRTLLQLARRHRLAQMPGYTHTQPAQPITLGFHLLARFWGLQRDGCRIQRALELLNWCPLGSAALAGTGFAIDRELTARELEFDGPLPSALDATSDRTVILDVHHALSCLMIDLSGIAQELITWSSQEFGFVRLSDDVTTGSSIMPQKRNADMAELIRGRTSRVIAAWVGLASTIKAMPLGYHRDFQDDKPALFETLDVAEKAVGLTDQMLGGAIWNVNRMRAASLAGGSLATVLADLLAERGYPFREAHEVVGLIAHKLGSQEPWTAEPLAQAIAGALGQDLEPHALAERVLAWNPADRRSKGSTGREAMAEQLRHASKLHRRAGFGSAY